MAIHQLIYRSTATKRLEDEEVGRLVAQARIQNFSLSITGVLFYADQQFLQVLEGEPATVEQLYHHIRDDVRHTDLAIVFSALAPRRLFPNWSMGFSPVAAVALSRLSRYLDPDNRAELLPKSVDEQEVITDLLSEFVEEQVITWSSPRSQQAWQ